MNGIFAFVFYYCFALVTNSLLSSLYILSAHRILFKFFFTHNLIIYEVASFLCSSSINFHVDGILSDLHWTITNAAELCFPRLLSGRHITFVYFIYSNGNYSQFSYQDCSRDSPYSFYTYNKDAFRGDLPVLSWSKNQNMEQLIESVSFNYVFSTFNFTH